MKAETDVEELMRKMNMQVEYYKTCGIIKTMEKLHKNQLRLINQFKASVEDELLAYLIKERGIELAQEDIIAISERNNP